MTHATDPVEEGNLDEGTPKGPIGTAPGWLVHLFRVGTVALLIGYFYFVFCNARVLLGAFGFQPGMVIVGAIATFVMAAMIVFAVGVPELPQILFGHILPQLRFARGLCPICGYDRHGRQGPCTECGAEDGKPPPYRLTSTAIRRFIWMVLTAWLLGVAAGEWWMLADDARFSLEANQAEGLGLDKHRRPRQWPCAYSMISWSRDSGFGSDDR